MWALLLLLEARLLAKGLSKKKHVLLKQVGFFVSGRSRCVTQPTGEYFRPVSSLTNPGSCEKSLPFMAIHAFASIM